jgi:DNA mismatch repair protein MutS
VQNYRIAVKEMGDRIVWLRKVLPGGTDKSYGVQVARMAGLPPTIITRAGEILVDLEKQGKGKKEMKEIVTTKTQKLQMTLFEAEPDPIIEEIKTVDLATLSPIEALNLLYR